MFIKRNLIILYISIFIAIYVASILAVYQFSTKPSQKDSIVFYGTYQLEINNIDHSKNLAIIPPAKADSEENEGQFQIYNSDKKILMQGKSRIDKNGYVSLDVNGKRMAVLYFANENYYYVDKLIKPQMITKISDEPLVAKPL